jgi:type II secretory pathway pseudopilin PulG
MTLIELVIVLSALSIVLAICFAFLASVQTAVVRADTVSQTTDAARLALDDMDRQIRSGNVLYDPAVPGEGMKAGIGIADGFSMRIYTQANGPERCVQWRVNGATLQSRSWSESWQTDGLVTGWRNVATSIVNASTAPPFSLDATAGFGGRLVDLDLFVNQNSRVSSTIEVRQAVTGRNTEYGYDPTVCNSIPSP